jgi:hypothetical protein
VLHLLAEFPDKATYPSADLDRRHPLDAEPYASISDLAALSADRRHEIRLYAGHFPFIARDLIGPDVKTFTLVRDPIDRTISMLKHFKRRYERFQDAPLDEVYEDQFVYRHFIENYQAKVFAVTAEDRPDAFVSSLSFQEIRDELERPRDRAQAESITRATATALRIDDDGLGRAMANLAQVDAIGTDERLRDFVEELRRRFGWWSAGTNDLPRANISSEPWVATGALRKRIARDNAIDLEFFRYATALVRQRQG